MVMAQRLRIIRLESYVFYHCMCYSDHFMRYTLTNQYISDLQ